MKYTVYILRTSANTLYTGYTNNFERRLKEHQSKSGKSARYVRYFDSVEPVYTEEFSTRAEAMKRESELKKLSKATKEKLISSGKI